MKRSLLERLCRDVGRKILIISGPRQCGKTTLARMIDPDDHEYLSWGNQAHRTIIRRTSWDRKRKYIILDELHKMPNWKRWLKGVFDTEGLPPGLVVTSSSRLDTFKKMGDSLAGRYFMFHLHPFDVGELAWAGAVGSPREHLERILNVGGFPEPHLEPEPNFYGRWSQSHLDIILRQDLIDTETVRSLPSVQLLIDLLTERVGSPLSYRSLAEDIQVSDKTIKRWLGILENMLIVFAVRPYHRNVGRARLKQPKYYFFDTARVRNGSAARLENAVACSLLKECDYRRDCLGKRYSLHYVFKKGVGEVDFLVANDHTPEQLVEVKWSDTRPANPLRHVARALGVPATQLVHDIEREASFPQDVEMRRAGDWLANFGHPFGTGEKW